MSFDFDTGQQIFDAAEDQFIPDEGRGVPRHDKGLCLKDASTTVPREGTSLESLMQDRDSDKTAVTVDEIAENIDQHKPCLQMQDQVVVHPNFIPAQPMQGPLPMTSPLQLVYLQPTPYGVNIIPFQATGHPSSTPYCPPGFPAHPHHPVVYQTGVSHPSHQPTFFPSQPVYSPGPYPAPVYPQYSPVPYHPYNPGPAPYQHPATHSPMTMVPSTPFRQPTFFRPWEGGSHGVQQAVMCPRADCVAEEDQHNQSARDESQNSSSSQAPPYSEEDFPALSSVLSKLKIKK